MKNLIHLIVILFFSSTAMANTIVLKPTAANEIYYPHGGIPQADTIKIQSGNYVSIVLTGIFGNGKKVVIMPEITGSVKAGFVRVDSSEYFKFTGFNAGTLNAGAGIAIELCSHYEICNNEIHDSQVGLYCKKNPNPNDPRTQYPNYVIYDVDIHDNYIHNVHGEGMYIGHTYPNADPYNLFLTPVRMRFVRIHNNRVEYCDWDGIQLSNATDSCTVHDNKIRHAGLIDMGDQRAGLIVGSNTNATVYNNLVFDVTGNGIQIFGYGYCPVYNNTIQDAGLTKDPSANGRGEQSIFTKSCVNIENRPLQYIDVFSNTIIGPMPRGILQTNNDALQSNTARFRNNKVEFKDTIPTGWEISMIGISQANRIVTGNTAISLLLSTQVTPVVSPLIAVTIPVTSWGATAKGYVYIPHDYSIQKSCPVVIFFHGVTEAGTDPTKLLNQGLPKLLNEGMSLDSIINPTDGRAYSFIAISLQANSWSPDPSWVPYEIAYLKSHYKIDESRIYVTGLSAGGINSLLTLQIDSIASKIAAAAPMSVPNSDFKDGQYIAKYKIKTWFFAGLSDYALPYTTYYKNLCDSVYPGSSKLTTYPCGHGCWNDHYNVTWKDNVSGLSLWQWFLSNQLNSSKQTLIALPTHFLNVDAALINDHQIKVTFNAADVNAKQFFIEVSTDGIHFKKVTVIVPGNANPNKPYTQIIDL
jgi:hypothetical protein